MVKKHRALIERWESLLKALSDTNWKSKQSRKRIDRLTTEFIRFEREFYKAV